MWDEKLVGSFVSEAYILSTTALLFTTLSYNVELNESLNSQREK